MARLTKKETQRLLDQEASCLAFVRGINTSNYTREALWNEAKAKGYTNMSLESFYAWLRKHSLNVALKKDTSSARLLDTLSTIDTASLTRDELFEQVLALGHKSARSTFMAFLVKHRIPYKGTKRVSGVVTFPHGPVKLEGVSDTVWAIVECASRLPEGFGISTLHKALAKEGIATTEIYIRDVLRKHRIVYTQHTNKKDKPVHPSVKVVTIVNDQEAAMVMARLASIRSRGEKITYARLANATGLTRSEAIVKYGKYVEMMVEANLH
ncbi:hypothetical protein AWB71_05341 [Caballeronia peredens]|nr:hypothetical protein AWB71_05341 [Caballeronia peredens]